MVKWAKEVVSFCYSLKLRIPSHPVFIQLPMSSISINTNWCWTRSHISGHRSNIIGSLRRKSFTILNILHHLEMYEGGRVRAILDLTQLNKWMKKMRFRMETLTSVVALLSQGDFLASVGYSSMSQLSTEFCVWYVPLPIQNTALQPFVSPQNLYQDADGHSQVRF